MSKKVPDNRVCTTCDKHIPKGSRGVYKQQAMSCSTGEWRTDYYCKNCASSWVSWLYGYAAQNSPVVTLDA